jgi:hypothetical protein
VDAGSREENAANKNKAFGPDENGAEDIRAALFFLNAAVVTPSALPLPSAGPAH